VGIFPWIQIIPREATKNVLTCFRIGPEVLKLLFTKQEKKVRHIRTEDTKTYRPMRFLRRFGCNVFSQKMIIT